MTSENPLKHLWTEYNKLKNWTGSTNPIKFTIECSSFDEMDELLSATNENIVTITGLIYPTTEPFTDRILRIEIHLPITYPQKAPEIYMRTNIRHPNIDKNSKIWCNYLESSNTYEPFMLSTAVDSIIQTIDQPESSHIFDNDLYMLYKNNRAEYNRKMKERLINYGVRRPDNIANTSSENDIPPKDDAEQLLQYLDIFYPNGVSINTVFNTDRNTAPEYKPEVNNFFENVVGNHAHDLSYNLYTTYRMSYVAEKIAKANWTEIKQMLTCIARAERLSMYQYAHAIEDNRIKWILLRVKELAK